MSETAPLRIAVIGAGIVGVSCALFLQRDGHRVTLIDPRDPGTGTSFGNAGIISLGSMLPVGTPGTLRQMPGMLTDPMSPLALRWSCLPRLLPWLARLVLASRPSRVEAISKNLAALTAGALQAHDILIQQCGAGELVRSGGWLKVARNRETLHEKTAAERRCLADHGISHHLLDGNACRELEPALAPDIAAGLWIDANRSVSDSLAYTERLAATFFERNGTQVKAKAVGLSIESGRINAVETDGAAVPAQAAVLAAGAFGQRLALAAGDRIPLDAERGYHVMLPHPEPTLTRPVLCIERGFVLAPMLKGIRLTGGVELASPEAPPDFRRIRRLAAVAGEYLPAIAADIQSEWQGCRPSLPDSLPVLGPSPATAGLFYAFGHQHIGLTLGPVTGRIIADLVAGRDPGLDLAPYRADRSFC